MGFVWNNMELFTSNVALGLNETRGPGTKHYSPDHHQQTVQSEKRRPEWKDSNECMFRKQYISMLL